MENTETAITDLIGQLGGNLDNLQDVLGSLINTSLSETAKKLPLLDRAKLYVLATYAIESVVFSCLRLNGTSAREHPVYRELARVKQYFEKIKLAESGDQRPNLRLDQAAAGRIIRHALSQQASRGAEQGGKSDRGQNAQPSSEVHSRKRKADELEVHEPVVTSPGVESKAQNQLIANSEKKYEAQNAVTSSPEAKSEIQNKVVPTQGIKAKGSSSDSSCVNEDVSVPKGRKGQVQAAKVLKGLETGASKSSDPSRHTSESRKHKKTKQDRKKQQAEMVSSETPVDKPKKKKRKKSKSSKDALSD